MRIIAAILFLFWTTPAWAAFPVQAGAATVATEEATTHDATSPGSIGAGDLLVLVITLGNASLANPTVSDGMTGWTHACSVAGGHTDYTASTEIWYRVADSSEVSFQFNTSATAWSMVRWLRITGAQNAAPECSTGTEFTSANPDSDSLTPSWGSLDTLWYAIQGHWGGSYVTAYPTDYGLYQYTNTENQFVGVGGGMAARELNGASQDPAEFTLNDSGQGIAFTVAIRPAAEAPAAVARHKPIMVE